MPTLATLTLDKRYVIAKIDGKLYCNDGVVTEFKDFPFLTSEGKLRPNLTMGQSGLHNLIVIITMLFCAVLSAYSGWFLGLETEYIILLGSVAAIVGLWPGGLIAYAVCEAHGHDTSSPSDRWEDALLALWQVEAPLDFHGALRDDVLGVEFVRVMAVTLANQWSQLADEFKTNYARESANRLLSALEEEYWLTPARAIILDVWPNTGIMYVKQDPLVGKQLDSLDTPVSLTQLVKIPPPPPPVSEPEYRRS